MAKTAEGDPAKVVELKRELRVMVKAILEERENNDVSNSSSSSSSLMEAIDRASEVLSALKELKKKGGVNKTASLSLHDHDGSFSCPPEFRCPLSKKLMTDPVVISSGQTYDRAMIQKWLKAGHRICPITQQVLSHTLLTPNFLIKEMISQWCQSHDIETPDPLGHMNEEGLADEADREHFSMLLSKMAKSIQEQKAAAKELRLLTKRMPSFRALFGESTDTIVLLLKPLLEQNGGAMDRDLQEDLITTVLNISIQDSNKKLVAETPKVISLLIDALSCGSTMETRSNAAATLFTLSSTMETRSNAAATLFTLSALDSNKILIGKSGALKPLIDLLDEGHPMAMKDSASAIFNLCIVQENKSRAVKEGAVRVILKKIKGGVQVDELLAILAMLSTHQRAVEEMAELGAVSCLLRIARVSPCPRNRENCIATLYTICSNDRSKLREVREEERGYGTLSKLAQDGTSRAKRKACGLLERLNRVPNLTYTA